MKKIIDKPWGREEVIEINDKYMVKKLLMKNGCQCSYQYHEIKRETVYVLSGDLTVILENKELVLKPGESMTLAPLVKHRMTARSGDCYYLEASTPEMDDVIRINDDYGRK